MIQATASKLGYLDCIEFLNSSPVAGSIAEVAVNQIRSHILVADYWLYCVEMYETPTKYWGCVLMLNGYAMVIRQGSCFFITTQLIPSLFEVSEEKGLLGFSSESIPLYDILDSSQLIPSRQLSIVGVEEFGCTTFFVQIKSMGDEIYQTGILRSLTLRNESLGNYNIKLDKDVPTVVVVKGAKNKLTRLSIRISPTVIQEYSYSRLGEEVSIPSTPTSLEDIANYKNKGLLF